VIKILIKIDQFNKKLKKQKLTKDNIFIKKKSHNFLIFFYLPIFSSYIFIMTSVAFAFVIFTADNNQPEALNKKALAIITRVRDKLTGRDFSHEETLSVRQQVDLLIQQATNNENLCQCYIGWYVMIYN